MESKGLTFDISCDILVPMWPEVALLHKWPKSVRLLKYEWGRSGLLEWKSKKQKKPKLSNMMSSAEEKHVEKKKTIN